MQSLTIVYTTAREEPEFDWFIESLRAQWDFCYHPPRIVVVDFYASTRKQRWGDLHIEPKPTIFQGKHRLTSEDFWAVSNSRNSGLCHASSQWVAFVDDRSVLGQNWAEAIEDAMDGKYMVCGSYEKRHNMFGEEGVITEQGELVSKDNRLEHCEANNIANPIQCTGNWVYGCGVALPVEWALQVGGFEEAMDGAGFEDVLMGMMCDNNGFPIKYDRRMHLIEDRTPSRIGKPMRREDRGISPNDASHRSLEIFGTARNTTNRHRLLQSRKAVLAEAPFPVLLGEHQDWFNADPINENYMKR